MNKFSAPFMQKSTVDEKKKIKKLKEKVEMARRAAFIKSKSESEDYEESTEEKIAQKKYKRVRKKLDKKEQK